MLKHVKIETQQLLPPTTFYNGCKSEVSLASMYSLIDTLGRRSS